MKSQKINWTKELSQTDLPDRRYEANVIKMAECIDKNPGLSFSAACGRSLRKSGHRLFSHKELDLLSGHRINMQQRVSNISAPILVIEDTTDLNYATHKSTVGLGDIGGGKPKSGEKYLAGLSMHLAMVCSLSGLPLGLLGNHIWAPVNETRKSSLIKNLPIEEKESIKWLHTLDWVKEYLSQIDQEIIIVGDREGDFYEHYQALKTKELGARVDLVVRLLHKHRNILYEGKKMNIRALMMQLEEKGERTTQIRYPSGKKGRTVTFSIAYSPIICPPSTNRKGENIPMFIVKATEKNPLNPKEPLEWIIMTSRPVNSLEQAIFILEIYEKRWLIERFFYVLKQAFRVERLQFDNFERLSNALSLYNLVTWKTLRISMLSKTQPKEDASVYFDQQEIDILQKVTNRQIVKVKDYILALTTLTNFERSSAQPFPGEKLLWQALKIFENIKKGFLLAHNYGTG